MQKKEWYFPSADGKTNIHAVEYRPVIEKEIKGVILLVHGCGEECRFYEETAQELAWNGYLVRTYDQIGHGLSAAEGQKRVYLGPRGSWKYALEDLHTLRSLPAEGVEKRIPVILLGHSMGAFLVREYLIRYGNVDAAVISGSGIVPALGIKCLRMILNRETKKNGYDSNSDRVGKLMHGANNRKIKGAEQDIDWLVKDPKGKQLMLDGDPEDHRITAGIFIELIGSMLYSQDRKNLKKMKKDMPILFVAGKEDPSVEFGRSVKSAVRLYRKCGMKQVTYKLYENGRHCIFQDYPREQVCGDIIQWLDRELQIKN